MAFRAYLWGLRVGTLFSGFAWLLIVNYIDPDKSGTQGIILFGASLFLTIVGAATMFLFWIRRIYDIENEFHAQLGMSFREGILAAVLVITLLMMQRAKVLVWWDGLLLLAGIFLIELFLLGHYRIKHKL